MQFFRALHLAAALAANFAAFAWLFARRAGRISLHDRAVWMHYSCKRVARSLRMTLTLAGTLPKMGLVTSNHLSYLDILAFASAGPCVFVSKSEVMRWPVFGVLARCGGTLFVNRERRTAVETITRQMEDTLAAGLPLVIFPEGTSTDGAQVLPYFPSLLESAVRCSAPSTPAAVGYRAEGWQEIDFCYFADVSFALHLRNMLRVPHSQILIRFGGQQAHFANRKQAAQQLRDQTVKLRETMRSEA